MYVHRTEAIIHRIGLFLTGISFSWIVYVHRVIVEERRDGVTTRDAGTQYNRHHNTLYCTKYLTLLARTRP